MKLSLAPAISLALLAGCAPAADERTETSEAAYSDYDTMMKQACLRALPEEEEAAWGDGPAIADAAELARGFIEVTHVFCSNDFTAYDTPYCGRDSWRETVDSNAASAEALREGRSYRHVVASIEGGNLTLTSPSTTGFPPVFEVSGPFSDLHVVMKPGSSSSTLPEDLALLQSYFALDLRGRMTSHELVLTQTQQPVRTWNTVRCGRASLRMAF
jgi:hypothetical protein